MTSTRPIATAERSGAVRVSDLLGEAATDPGDAPAWQIIATGFTSLDQVLGGGIRTHDLVIVGGLPGVGKTVAALQIAQQVAAAGEHALYVCYEHDARVLLGRLLLQELAQVATGLSPLERDELGAHLRDTVMTPNGLQELLRDPRIREAHDRLSVYADRLVLVPASGAHSDLEHIQSLLDAHPETALLVVDYLQKVSVRPEPPTETAKVTTVTEGLKDLAMSRGVTVIAIVAADRTALDASRVRLHHLRGSSALAYEADVALILNEKFQCISRVHLSFDPVHAAQFRDWVVFTVEKNRGGPAQVDVEFRKDFTFYRFEPDGRRVSERLVDERLVLE